jgi:Lon protease-like protein
VVEPSGAAVERFTRLAVDGLLDAAVLAVASALRPPVDEAAALRTLDGWAAQCETPTFDAVRDVLFERVGLVGATDDYGDPENSMLDAVIARRRGIPITLSIVAIEVARRVGAIVEPIGMPGHFLVRDRATGLYCDAFAGGTLLDAHGCEARFRTLFGPDRPFSIALLEPTPRPLVLARVLANLEASRWAVDPRRLRTMLELHRRCSRRAPTSAMPSHAPTPRAPARIDARVADTEPLPMFPLGTVLLPGGVLPLHVFEPRYRVMVRELLDGDGEFGVVLISRGHEVGGGDTREDIGCRARLARAEELPDGRFALVAVGVDPIDVVEWLADDPYPRARVTARHDADVDPVALAGAGDAVRSRLDELIDLVAPDDAAADATRRELALPDEPLVLAWSLADPLSLGPFDRQRLLTAPDSVARLERLAEMLDDRVLIARAGRPEPGETS